MIEELHLFRFLFGLVLLSVASYLDWKTRRVTNKVWIIMGVGGLVALEAQLIYLKLDWTYHLAMIPIVILFFDVFLDREVLVDVEEKKVNWPYLCLYLVALVVIIYQLVTLGFDRDYIPLLTIPIMIAVGYGLYLARILHGGADAKAFMALALLLPYYPILSGSGFPVLSMDPVIADEMQLAFPYALLILMNAAILFIFSPLVFLIYNASKKNLSLPEALVGYKTPIEKAKNSFVWPMERIEDGVEVLILFPKRGGNPKLEFDRLKRFGKKEVWVTPKIPFIIPLTFGFVLSFFVGNILYAFMSWLSG